MLSKKQVLIVEDNAINREMLRTILEDDYRVLEAENGLAALDVLSHHREDISLILLDVRMPVMDGYAFLDRIKKDAGLALIPVIVTTQSDSELDEVSALAHGATDFVPKPYRPQVILHRAASLIKLRETAAMVNQFQFDRLTGLYTKEFFYQKVRERLVGDTEHEYTIICSNIENFKLYNDTFGREAGDRLLREFAERFLASLGDMGLCGRYSADRFLFLQERECEKRSRIRFFDRLKGDDSPWPGNISLKWGIYEITDRSIPIDQMCDRALLAADSARGRYNQPFVIYDDMLRAKLLREKALVDSMTSALSQKQFTVYYQPKYGMKEERMAGAEALARWVHPELGFISPGEFIPLFERNGFITRLDQYVWETVCQQMADWKRRGLPLVPVSVNISRADVCQADLAGVLCSLTQQYGIDPAELHLEITESAYASHPESIVAAVEALRALGFIVEMDDFGSGYSSLNMLSQMKLDILKLDMQFIQSEIAKPEEQSILHDVVRMAHRLRLGVVAEGVETKDQLEYLRAIGCDYLQGYYLARPMPCAEFEALLGAQPSGDVPRQEIARPAHDGLPTLLVADEDEAYRTLVRRTFRSSFHVVDVPDAAGALACIAEELPSAILLSMTLPGGGSGEVLSALRQNPAYWHIPVLSLIPRCDAGAAISTPDTDDFLCRCHPQSDLRRRVSRMLELSCARERESLLRDEANRDFATGLRNRRGLRIAMDALRREDLPLALCLFDLDNLKQINDAHGREAGDRVIQSFADLLRSQTRDGDIRCRYDGNTFVVILRRIRGGEDALRRAEQICRAFRATAGDIPASCTAGIALCGIGDRPSGQLLEQAEQALFNAKQENRGFCCLWPEKG